jgi:hypothetical protein
MHRVRVAVSCFALVIMLSGCGGQSASGLLSVTAVLGEAHSFAAGERVPGDVYALAGELTVEEDAVIGGSLLVLGGEATVGGKVAGDVSLIGGRLRMLSSAQVDGALTVAGGELDLDPRAAIEGGVLQAQAQPPARARFGGSPLLDLLLRLLLPALAVGTFAYLLARYATRPFGRVSAALGGHFLVSAAMGSLAGITALVLLVLVAFTILLIPFSFAGAAALLVGIAYGWAAFGGVTGHALRSRWPRLSQPLSAALGGFLFMVALDLLGRVPVVGLIVPPLAAAAGLGAVILTRLGLSPFVPASDVAPDVVVE